MANSEHVRLLRQGSDQWNKWRYKNPQIQPDLHKANLRKANLHKARLFDADLSKADLREADLSGAIIGRADLSKVDLSRADLSKAYLREADLSGANLSEADLSGADLNMILRPEVNLSGSHLNGVNLSKANLSSAVLSNASLNGVNLSEADLSEADLSEAILSGANLRGANLRGAYLSQANLREANLREANLSNAKLLGTVIAKTDLRYTKGLTTINHMGPSHIELFSVQLPQDGSALHFLRGAGVPDEWIDDYRAHMMHPIQYHSCFLSYCSKDEMLAKRLHADLQAQGVRCWFAPEDMKIGDRIRQRIDEAIHLQDKLLLLLSEHSLASSWVENEVEAAFAKEQRQDREVLFPIRLDSAVMQTTQAWAATLQRTRHIGDFSQWTEPEAYQSAFMRLLRDLKQS